MSLVSPGASLRHERLKRQKVNGNFLYIYIKKKYIRRNSCIKYPILFDQWPGKILSYFTLATLTILVICIKGI